MGIRALCASLAVLGLISSARAGVVNLLTNGSLAKNTSIKLNSQGFLTASTTSNKTALPGWTIVSGSVDIVSNKYWQSADGAYKQSADLANTLDMIGSPGLGAIQQSVTTTSGTTYNLTFDLSASPLTGGSPSEKTDTKVLEVEALSANGTVISSQTYNITVGTRTISNMQFQENTFSFVATGSASTLRILALTPLNLPKGKTASNVYTGPVIGNLVLQEGASANPAPEPASLGVLGLGISALLLKRRRGH